MHACTQRCTHEKFTIATRADGTQAHTRTHAHVVTHLVENLRSQLRNEVSDAVVVCTALAALALYFCECEGVDAAVEECVRACSHMMCACVHACVFMCVRACMCGSACSTHICAHTCLRATQCYRQSFSSPHHAAEPRRRPAWGRLGRP